MSVVLFDQEPQVQLLAPEVGSLAAGAEREPHVLDLRTTPGGWMFPLTAGEGWGVDDLPRHVRREMNASQFCRTVAADLAVSGGTSLDLSRCVLAYRSPAAGYGPPVVLDRLIEAIWATMRHVSNRTGLTVPSPPRPPSTWDPIDRYHAAFDSLGNWLRETRQPRPPTGAATGQASAGVQSAEAAAVPATVLRDGPRDGRWIIWDGVRHPVPAGVVYRLIDHMWERSEARYGDLMVGEPGTNPVWDSEVGDQTVRSRTSQVGKVLKKIGVPWRLEANARVRIVEKVPA